METFFTGSTKRLTNHAPAVRQPIFELTDMLVSNEIEANVYDDGYLRVEYDFYYLACRGIPIYSFSRLEFLVFACLLRANGRPVSHQEIWHQVWQEKEFSYNIIRVHVAHVRRKLKTYGIDIIPKSGVGYYLRIVPQEQLKSE
jgi:DNA-binding response OmpR family regulator